MADRKNIWESFEPQGKGIDPELAASLAARGVVRAVQIPTGADRLQPELIDSTRKENFDVLINKNVEIGTRSLYEVTSDIVDILVKHLPAGHEDLDSATQLLEEVHEVYDTGIMQAKSLEE
jgi:hypothetical protein